MQAVRWLLQRCASDISGIPTACGEGLPVAAGGASYQLSPCGSYAGQCCWLKLLLPDIGDIDYLLYLDCDVLVRDDPWQLLLDARSTFQVCVCVCECMSVYVSVCVCSCVYVSVGLCVSVCM